MVQESQRPPDSEPSKAASAGRAGVQIPVELKILDSYLRLLLSLVDLKKWDMLALRTGIQCPAEGIQYLHLFFEVNRELLGTKEKEFGPELLDEFELTIATAYFDEYRNNDKIRTISARIAVTAVDVPRTLKGVPLGIALAKIAASGVFGRVRLAVPHGKYLQRSLEAIDLPPGQTYKHHRLRGKDIVIGIIDDGCAFAHPDFLRIRRANGKRVYRSRLLSLWDQSVLAPSKPDQQAGWTTVDDFGYGRELPQAAIDAELANHVSQGRIDEDAVYSAFDYGVGMALERATHGTRVMGIAAGNGNSLTGWHGVAPRADIIFVQLPPDAIKKAPQLLSTHIVDAVHFIFRRAEQLNKQAAVVNVSYGGHSGPHDGTTAWETAIDELLAMHDRAVVVSAGNGFEADCHATAVLQAGEEKTLRWMLNANDTTGNDLEIWYNGDATLDVWVKAPDENQEAGPFAPGTNDQLKSALTGSLRGGIEHVQNDVTNGDNSIMVALGPTATTGTVSAPPGTWSIRLKNVGNAPATFHAWIQRDDFGRDGLRQQSRFAPDDANPGCTISDFSGGHLTISAGAFNAATGEVCPYSACGPTRTSKNNPARKKPDVLAPAEELASGGGVMTSASRLAIARRLNGTSAAAPHVAGIVALAFDYRRNHKSQHLSATELRAALLGEPVANRPLSPTRRPGIRTRARQKNVWNELTGIGRISCKDLLDKL